MAYVLQNYFIAMLIFIIIYFCKQNSLYISLTQYLKVPPVLAKNAYGSEASPARIHLAELFLIPSCLTHSHPCCSQLYMLSL